MDPVDLQYCAIVSSRVDRFKVKQQHPYKANFRCPICGDSQKSRSKARGWLLEKDNRAIYYCHNCGFGGPLGKFLREWQPSLYNDYIVDKKMSDLSGRRKPAPKPLDKLRMKAPEFTKKSSPLSELRKISTLNPNHPAKKYVERRMIPSNQHHRIYYAPRFNAWVNSMVPEKLNDKLDEPRLVLPYIGDDGVMFGFTGRSFKKESLRYLTIMLDDTKTKAFGMEGVDFSKRFYVVEGPIDSLFLPNSMAMSGADIDIRSIPHLENAVFVLDNEPRNKEICDKVERLIRSGCTVFIWPKTIEHKDINECVLHGIDPTEMKRIIDKNSFSGLEASLAMMNWRVIRDGGKSDSGLRRQLRDRSQR